MFISIEQINHTIILYRTQYIFRIRVKIELLYINFKNDNSIHYILNGKEKTKPKKLIYFVVIV